MGETKLAARALSVEDYFASEDGASERHEFIDGIVYAMIGGLIAPAHDPPSVACPKAATNSSDYVAMVHLPTTRRGVLAGGLCWLAGPALASPSNWGERLVSAALKQIGVTTIYDPAYVQLAYPGGDIPRQRGVCTDVVIRAYRDAFGLDLQQLIHEDMLEHFDAYPHRYGLTAPNSNIDHRRVPNLQAFFRRRGEELTGGATAADYSQGDLVTVKLPANLDHIMIVAAADLGQRPPVIHNIGGGAQLEDRLFEFPLTGHYRFAPDGG